MCLNQPVPRSQLLKRSASPGRNPGFLYWILALLLAAGLVWVWQRTRRNPPVAAPVVQQPVRTPAPAPQPAPARPAAPPVVPPVAEPVRPVPAPRSDALRRVPQDTFEVQLALARLGISSGSLDGVMGSQTRAALLAFQQREHLPMGPYDEHAALFGAARVEEWLGPEELAMCIDYRWPQDWDRPALGAYRPDLGELVFWDGRLKSRWGKG